MSLINDMQSIVDYVKLLYPTATIIKQNPPATPAANTFVIRLMSSTTDSETLYHMRKSRDYQFLYYGSSASDVIDKLDAIERKTMNDIVIPIKGSLRYLRVEGFSFGMPFKTESGVDLVLGVLQTEIREARDQAQYEKIMKLYVKNGFDANTWNMVDGTASPTDANTGFTWQEIEAGSYLFEKE